MMMSIGFAMYSAFGMDIIYTYKTLLASLWLITLAQLTCCTPTPWHSMLLFHVSIMPSIAYWNSCRSTGVSYAVPSVKFSGESCFSRCSAVYYTPGKQDSPGILTPGTEYEIPVQWNYQLSVFKWIPKFFCTKLESFVALIWIFIWNSMSSKMPYNFAGTFCFILDTEICESGADHYNLL